MRFYFVRHKKIGMIEKYIFYSRINNKKYIKSISKYSFIQKIEIFHYVYKKSLTKAKLIFDSLFSKEIFINDFSVPSKFFKLVISLKLNTPEITKNILEEDFKDKNFTDIFFISEVYKNEEFKKIDKISNKQSLYQHISEHYNCFNEALLSLNYSNKLFENKNDIESENSLYENNIYSLIYKYYQNHNNVNYNYEDILKRHSPDKSFIALVYINMLKYSYISIGNKIIFKKRNRENFKNVILNSQNIINHVFKDNIITHNYLKNDFLISMTEHIFSYKIFSPYKTREQNISINIHNNIINYNLFSEYFSLFKELKEDVDFIDFNYMDNIKDSVHHFLIKIYLIQYKLNHLKNNLQKNKIENDSHIHILNLLEEIKYSKDLSSFLKEYLHYIPEDFIELRSKIELFLIKNMTFNKKIDNLPSLKKRL